LGKAVRKDFGFRIYGESQIETSTDETGWITVAIIALDEFEQLFQQQDRREHRKS
jgi:hypothetical protein